MAKPAARLNSTNRRALHARTLKLVLIGLLACAQLVSVGGTNGSAAIIYARAQNTAPMATMPLAAVTAAQARQAAALTATQYATNVLTITKTISGTGSGPFALDIAGPHGYSTTAEIDGGQVLTVSLPSQGTYTVTEATPAGWSTVYTATPGTGGGTQAVVTLSATNAATLPATNISGTVFRDFNSDGQITDDGTILDSGLGGVTVTAYDKNGVVVGSAATAGDGTYTIIPVGDGPYRVEFSNLPVGYAPTTHGNDNGTSTQFVTSPAGASNVNLGVSDPCDFCQDNPLLVVPVYRNGDPLGGGTSGTRVNSFALAYDAGGTSPTLTDISLHSDTGAIWGQAYHREGKQLLRAAVVRRHDGLGTGGLGAIYRTDLTGAPSTSLLVDLETLGVDFGTIADNSTRGLPAAANGVNVDAAAFPLVGKTGIGGIDLAPDGDTLYVMNLFDRKLYQAPLPDPTVAPASLTEVGTMPWLATDPCTNGVARPWAVKQYRDKVYVGLVCTAENEATAASTAQPAYSTLAAHVYAFDIGNNSWSQELSVPLNYTKGQTSAVRHGTLDRYWLAWVDNFVRDTNSGAGVSSGATFMMDNGRTSRPQPILSDLAFDTDGNMILGFMDRGGMQIGWSNRAPDYTSGTELLQYNISGDILRACGDPTGGWTLESGGVCGGVTGGGANGEGPGGGEFYDGDEYVRTSGLLHDETMNGALATLPGSDLVASAAMDPFNIDSGGVYWLSNSDGSKARGAQLYAESGSFSGSTTVTNGSFGKSGAMGDVAVLCDPPPLEIGNRVWNDINGDGVQDPGEPGLANLTVTLTGPSGAVTTDTDSNGNYYFGSLQPNTAYTLTMDAPVGFGLTTANAQALSGASVSSNHPISDTRDSDAVLLGGLATINYTTGEAGENNHGLDFGFTQPLAAKVEILNIAPVVSIGSFVWEDLNGNGLQDPGEPGIPNAEVTLLTSAGLPATDTNGLPVPAQIVGADGLYHFQNLPEGAYIVQVEPPPDFVPTANQNGGAIDAGLGLNVADNDSNIASSPAAGIYQSGVVTVTAAVQPTGAAESQPGGDQDDAGDANGNMTVDMGFVSPPTLAIRKVLNTPDPVRVGSIVSFTIWITNTGATTITVLPLEDTFDSLYLTYAGSAPLSDDSVSDGVVNWADLTSAVPAGVGGDLAPDAGITVVTRFVARRDTSLIGGALNRATVTGAEDQNGNAAEDVGDEAVVRVLAPTAVTVDDAYALRRGRTLTFHWRTPDESAIVAFRVLRVDEAGRETVLTPDAIVAKFAGQPMGAAYSYTTMANDVAGRYVLELVGPDGGVTRHDLGAALVSHAIYLPHVTR